MASTIEEFFDGATLNPIASLIEKQICDDRVEEIENSLTRRARYMDKLAPGKKVESALRS